MNRLLSLYQMAESDNIVVDCFALEKREAMSLTDDEGDCCIAIDPMKLSSTAEEKWKLAHELGHCYTGSFYTRYSLYEIRERLEWKAEKWAIKKLIPKDELYRCYENGITEPWDIADYFNLPEELVREAMFYYSSQEQPDCATTHEDAGVSTNPQTPKKIKAAPPSQANKPQNTQPKTVVLKKPAKPKPALSLAKVDEINRRRLLELEEKWLYDVK